MGTLHPASLLGSTDHYREAYWSQIKKLFKLSSIVNSICSFTGDVGDLDGADETIKFAHQMNMRLAPLAIRKFLILLAHHKRPAPLHILALKYYPVPRPAKPILPKPPDYKYKF